MTQAQDVINEFVRTHNPTTWNEPWNERLVDKCRWALQDAGVSSSDREKALVANGIIKPLQQDFGAMSEWFS